MTRRFLPELRLPSNCAHQESPIRKAAWPRLAATHVNDDQHLILAPPRYATTTVEFAVQRPQ